MVLTGFYPKMCTGENMRHCECLWYLRIMADTSTRKRKAAGTDTDVLDAVDAGIDDRLRRELEELVTQMCNAINEPKRLLVIYALGKGPRTVNQLAAILGAPQSNTSQHLAVLRNRGLVDVERRGTHVVYALRYPKIIEAVDLLRGVLSDEIARQHALRWVG